MYGNKFVLHTDHQPLVYLNNMKFVDSRLARTLEDLADFEFKIRYTPGSSNLAADALSRLSVPLFGVPDVKSEFFAKLPSGLSVIKDIPGEGDSMLDSLLVLLEEISLNLSFPESSMKSRQLLVDVIRKDPKKFGLSQKKICQSSK